MKAWTLVFFFVAAYAKHEKYIGWKSYSVTPSTKEQFVALANIDLEVDALSSPSVNREGVILVRPENQAPFTKFLDHHGISYKIHRNDMKAALDYDDEVIEATRRENIARNGKEMPYDNYQRYGVIIGYLEDIAKRFPDTVTLVTPANTFEGRPIKYLKISTTKFQDTKKPVIIIDGTIHAREWIAPPTVTYMIGKLTENVTEPDLLNNFDWVILPVVNPDGYEYSHTNDRSWRKTRSTNPLNSKCPGVDGNRNFDFFWNTVGVSSSPCSEIYPGPRPFSEIESRVVRDLLFEHLTRTALYLTIHSYGSLILYPWGHNGTLSHNAAALQTVGAAMADQITANQLPHFPKYQVGNQVPLLGYGSSGASEDYAHFIGVPLTYTCELPGLGNDGFNLPPKYIKQVTKETWEGVLVGVKKAGELIVPK